MALADSLHSRLVAWLKILLPLMALALLSTVFLFSRANDGQGTLPFADRDIADRAQEQQITAPHFAGTTDRGDIITLTARNARPGPDNADAGLARDLTARINTAGGGMITLGADTTWLEQAQDVALFEGNVHVDSSTGYQVRTEQLQSSLSTLYIESLGPVDGDGPAGRFSAGRMLIHAPEPGGAAQLLFTDGVNLIYQP